MVSLSILYSNHLVNRKVDLVMKVSPILVAMGMMGAAWVSSQAGAEVSRHASSAEKKTVTAGLSDASAALAELEIRNLISRYYDAAWRINVNDLLNTFAPDGELSYVMDGKWTTYKGHTALREYLVGALPKTKPFPLGHNHVVKLLSPTRAVGSIMNEQLKGTDFSQNSIVYYRDDYVLTPKGWRIGKRVAYVMKPGENPTMYNLEGY
jgi:SnoaL-like domain